MFSSIGHADFFGLHIGVFSDYQELSEITEALQIVTQLATEQELTDYDVKFIEAAIRTSSGQLNPLVATMGGVLAQVLPLVV